MHRMLSRFRLGIGTALVLALVPSFSALADGVPYFAQNDTIPDVMILVDASTSMAGPIQGSSGKPRIVHAVSLIKQLVQENKDIRWGLAHTSADTVLGCKTGAIDVQIGAQSTGSPTNSIFSTKLTNLECSVMGKDYFDCSKSPTILHPLDGKGCKYAVTCPSSAPSQPPAGKKDFTGELIPDSNSSTVLGEWKRSIVNDTGAKTCRKRAMIFVTGGGTSVIPTCVDTAHNAIAQIYSYPTTTMGLNGKTIPTYLLGFNLSTDYSLTELDMMAEAGQGMSPTGDPSNGVNPYSALSTSQFNAAFAEIYNQIIAGSYTNSSPVVSRDYGDIYQAYFSILNNPSLTEKYYSWQGHLQDYVLDPATGKVASDQSDSFSGKKDVTWWLDSNTYSSRSIYTSYDNGSVPYARVPFNTSNSSYFWQKLGLVSDVCDDDADGYADGDNADCDLAVNTINTTICPDSPFTTSKGVTGTQADANALIKFILGDTTQAYDGCAAAASDATTATKREAWRLLDIYNSTPRLLGPPSSYSADNTYDIWQSTAPQKDRPDFLVVGSNGGMIHAFKAAINTSATRTRSNGQELWGYIPQHILPKLKDIWRIDPHPTMIDATAGVEDVKIKSFGDSDFNWRTVAVIGDGINGDESTCKLDTPSNKPSYYCGYYTAVDVSNYEGGSWIVKPLWEFYGDADLLTAAATPEFGIVRDQTVGSVGNYKRSVVFLPGVGTDGTGLSAGWGLKPSVQKSPVYVVDMADGDGDNYLAKLELPWHTTTDPNQPHGVISRPLAVDTDNDLLADRLFVGDQEGYFWRMDLSSDKPSEWGVSSYAPEEIFTPGTTYAMTTVGAPYAGPKYLPISFPPAATYISSGDLLVYFGTGDPRTVSYGGPPGYFFAMVDKKAIVPGSSAKLLSTFTPIKFSAGEGLAGEPVLVNGVLYFTTYYVDTNTASSTNGCGLGKSRLWAVGYLDGSPQMDSDGNGTPDARFIELGRGIPGGVVIGYDRWYVQVNDGNVGGTSGSLHTDATASGGPGTVEPFMPYGWSEVTGRGN